MATSPSFTSTPRTTYTAISTANTARDGSGTVGTLITGVAAGTRVFEIAVKATGASTTAGMIRIFLSLDGGTTKRLIKEISVSAATPSATVQTFEGSASFENLVLPDASASIYVSTHNAEAFNVMAYGGDLT